ncbi:hypothetical protein LTS10_011149 [Elasticomyces elasticus]|nr:hypothetical protein LTS10_011149 [Elasticomyces elasticus]
MAPTTYKETKAGEVTLKWKENSAKAAPSLKHQATAVDALNDNSVLKENATDIMFHGAGYRDANGNEVVSVNYLDKDGVKITAAKVGVEEVVFKNVFKRFLNKISK